MKKWELQEMNRELLEALELCLATLERVYPNARAEWSSVSGTVAVVDHAIKKAKEA